ncbi:rho GTPase-activating protein 19 [Elysia marginata]|uniref:Rho GTPase-activating protein 19 n=1 Tax=Elysia marginata TaxID=1093978 RepID=A0AAV4G2Z8_9GAST|nr:rho GTPase-activating protein 19 [Elysia marginata]
MDHLNKQQWEYLEEKYISRTRKCVPDKFQEMCHMHLAFLLDLSGDKLEQLLVSGEQPQTKRKLGLSSAVNVFKKKEKAPTGLFGAPLTDESVCLMLPLIRFLKAEKHVCKEGLFRKPGHRLRMNALRDSLNVHGTATRLDPEVYSPYDVAGVLKEFLRELPEPLLTDKHMEAHRQIQEMGKHVSTEEAVQRFAKKKLSALQLLMLLVPTPARKMTLQVLWLLQRVADCPETRLTPTTLGTLFAPVFFLDRDLDAQEMCTAVSQAEPGLAFMIQHAHLLFKVISLMAHMGLGCGVKGPVQVNCRPWRRPDYWCHK